MAEYGTFRERVMRAQATNLRPGKVYVNGLGIATTEYPMSTGERLISLKLDNLKTGWANLSAGTLGMGGDTAGLKRLIDSLNALRNDVVAYVGEPKASSINTRIDNAVTTHLTYWKAGKVSDSKARIIGRIAEIKAVLETPMAVTTPAPIVPSPSATVATPAPSNVVAPVVETALAPAPSSGWKKLILPVLGIAALLGIVMYVKSRK